MNRYSFLASFLLIFLFTACTKTKEVLVQPEPDPPAASDHFIHFWFDPGNNASYLIDSVSLEIKGNIISGRVPYYTHIKSLKASFESPGSRVTVNGEVQKSGASAQDFSHPVQYEVTDPLGNTNRYTVTLLNFTGLPVIKINTVGSVPVTSRDNYLSAKIWIDGAGQYDDLEGEIDIKGRGHTSWAMAKKPYKIKFDKKTSLFGEPAHKKWVLLANYIDKTQIRNAVAFYMGNLSNLDWTPSSHFAEVFMNEEYIGTYEVTDQVEESSSRLDVGDDGYVLEIDQQSRLDPDDIFFKTPKNILFTIKDPDLEMGDEQYNYIKNYVSHAEGVLYSDYFTDPDSGYVKYLDIPSFVDWYLINEISKNNDVIFFSSVYMHLKRGEKLKMGAIWDFDLAFGDINYNNNQDPTGFYISKKTPWIVRLFKDSAFVAQVKERFAYFDSKRDSILSFINTEAAALRWSALENNNKWKVLYTNVWPNYAVFGSYNNEVTYMKNWLNTRMDWLAQAYDKL